MNKIFSIGHFSSESLSNFDANSPAGDQVQHEILKQFENFIGSDNTVCYSMQTVPAWPNGPILVGSNRNKNIFFPSFFNLPVIKHIHFAISVFFALLRIKPKTCVSYNSYLFENMAMLLFRKLRPETALVSILQDVNCTKKISFKDFHKIKKILEITGIELAKKFNLLIPISDAIASDFNFDKDKFFVFRGGLSKFSKNMMSISIENLENIAVFAGALEKYNGVDLLIDEWIAQEIDIPLHIFGKGSLAKIIDKKIKNVNSIFFHGFKSEEEIESWQSRARWNICLRFSIGINQNYFFPSKFFNIMAAEGGVICNKFSGIPEKLMPYIYVVDDDLTGISSIIHSPIDDESKKLVIKRRAILLEDHSWSLCIGEILQRLMSADNKN